MNKHLIKFFTASLLLSLAIQLQAAPATSASPFDEDVTFLAGHGEVIVLSDSSGESRVAVMPSLQGRVMTSTTGSKWNLSYGWINRPLFESGEISPHTNAFGGEERIWLGPEGGQYSIFFSAGSDFSRSSWFTPKLIDIEPWNVDSRTAHSATFSKTATLTNYSGRKFDVALTREVRVLDRNAALKNLGVADDRRLTAVTYQSINDLKNKGDDAWGKQSGLLMMWLLGRFNPSPDTTIVVPFKPGPLDQRGPIVIDEYYSKVPADRLKIKDGAIFFRGDGDHRSKIGVRAGRATGLMGRYDASNETLTIIKHTTGLPGDVYVNQKWEVQDHPYEDGDVVNAYNGGPAANGSRPVSRFFELESSSPARELGPGERLRHTQTTSHFQGDKRALDALSKAVLGVSLAQITEAFPQ